MQILRIINPANISESDANKLNPRLAARGVVINDKNLIAILPVSKHGYYKLPGGGIDEGENEVQAFRRECLEEIGFDVEVTNELGIIIEYRTEMNRIQTSYCYIGKVIGDRKEIALTDHEKSEGFKDPEWVSFDEALKKVSTSEPTNYEGKFIKERDTLILETAKNFI